MAGHWRAIQDSTVHSETLARLSHTAERLFWRMLSQTDSWGRVQVGTPMKLKARCAPLVEMTPEEVTLALDELVAVGRLVLYTAGGTIVAQLVDFDEHQPPRALDRRKPSRWPAPDESAIEAAQAVSAAIRADPSESERSGTEREKENETERAANAASAREDSAAIFEVYNCWRTERGKTNRRYDQPSDARRKKIAARLREFTVDELKQAIAAVALDPWEDRPRHDDLTVILRSREQVERFLSFAESPPAPRQSGRTGGLTAREIMKSALAEAG